MLISKVKSKTKTLLRCVFLHILNMNKFPKNKNKNTFSINLMEDLLVYSIKDWPHFVLIFSEMHFLLSFNVSYLLKTVCFSLLFDLEINLHSEIVKHFLLNLYTLTNTFCGFILFLLICIISIEFYSPFLVKTNLSFLICYQYL